MRKLKGVIKVECEHTFEFDLDMLKDSHYNLDDKEILREQIIKAIEQIGIEGIVGYNFEKEEYDTDDLEIKIIEEEK